MLRYIERCSWFHMGRRGQAGLFCDVASLTSQVPKYKNSLLRWKSARYDQDTFRIRPLSALTDSISSELIEPLPTDSLNLLNPASSYAATMDHGMPSTLPTNDFIEPNLLTKKSSSAVLVDGVVDSGVYVDVAVNGLSANDIADEENQHLQHPSDTDVHQNLLEKETDVQVDLGLQVSAPVHSVQQSPPEKLPDSVKAAIDCLVKAISRKDTKAAMNAFNQLMETNDRNRVIGVPLIEIPAGVVKGLFNLLQPSRTFDIFRVVEYYVSLHTTPEYQKDGGNLSAYTLYYHVVCDSVMYLDPRHNYSKESVLLVSAIIDRVSRMDHRGQEICVPRLLSSLVEQNSTVLGKQFTGKIYKYILDNNFNVSPGYWVRILTFSRYNRQDELPYDEILARVVELGLRPHPFIVLNVLENFFPFSNAQAVAKSLKAILVLQRLVAAEIKAIKTSTEKESAEIRNRHIADAVAKQYFIDMTVLETIGASAASQGESEICLMIWDMIDTLGYTPTEGIYENTVVAFAMNTFTYREAFIVLNEMESRGFVPSRALIRSVSIRVRDSLSNLDFAQEQILLLRREGKVTITTSMMNVLLSSAAERGDIDRVLSILHDFDRYGTAFNPDTISFGFESLGKNLSRRRKFNRTFVDATNAATRDHIGACMVVANALLNQMDDYQIETTDHIIRNYVEFLCLAGYVDTATTIVTEAVGRKGLVNSKSIYRVAMMNAKVFKFDVARQVARCDADSKPMQFLLDAIDREENLHVISLKHSYGQQYSNSEKSGARPSTDNTLSVDDDEHFYFDESHQQGVNQKQRSPPNLSTFWKTEITNDDNAL